MISAYLVNNYQLGNLFWLTVPVSCGIAMLIMWKLSRKAPIGEEKEEEGYNEN